MSFWDTFLPQLLATIVGAGIGVAGVWLAFRWQRSAAQVDAVDSSVEHLLQCMADFTEAAEAYWAEFQINNWSKGHPSRVYPSKGRISIAVELLRMRTKDTDRAMADLIGQTWNIVAHAPARERSTAIGVLAHAVTLWRLRESETAVLSSLETARQLSVDVEVSPDE